MAGQRRRMWGFVAVMALAAAGALALTTPRDKTDFVSARRPSPSKPAAGGAASGETPAGTGGVAATMARATSGRGPAGAVIPAGLAPGAAVTVAARGTANGRESGVTDAAAQGDSRHADAPATAEEEGARPPRGAAAERNLFRPLVVKAKPSLPPASLPPWLPGLDGLMPLDGAGPGARRQRASWEYVGTVQLEGVTYALIEEKKSKAGAYFKAGDAFRGGQVASINSEYVVLSLAGKDYRLPKSSGLIEEMPVPAAAAAPAAAPAQAAAPPQAAQASPDAGRERWSDEARRWGDQSDRDRWNRDGGRSGRRSRSWGR